MSLEKKINICFDVFFVTCLVTVITLFGCFVYCDNAEKYQYTFVQELTEAVDNGFIEEYILPDYNKKINPGKTVNHFYNLDNTYVYITLNEKTRTLKSELVAVPTVNTVKTPAEKIEDIVIQKNFTILTNDEFEKVYMCINTPTKQEHLVKYLYFYTLSDIAIKDDDGNKVSPRLMAKQFFDMVIN